MIVSLVLSIIILLITVYFGLNRFRKPPNYPPGPNWTPFLGCSPLVKSLTEIHGSQWKALSVLRKKYSSDVLGLKFGNELVVVLFGENNIKKMFLDKEFEGRPDNFFARLRCLGTRYGITFADGELWKKHRKFTMSQLKNVGFGKTLMEKEIQKETKSIVKSIRRSKDKALNPKNLLAMSVMNVLWKYTAGERINEERLEFMLDLFTQRTKSFSVVGGLLNQMPWCRHILPNFTGYSIISNLNNQISEIIENAILKHRRGDVAGDDFIYAFLKEMKDNEEYTEEHLKVICLDLLIAGSQTTSNTLLFAILMVLKNIQTQEKIYNEINTVIGRNTPSWTDSSRLTYTSAYLLEIQRYFTIVALVGPRRTLAATSIDGYSIPKGATVLSSLIDLHFDSQLWDKPNTFNPDRFIDERGKLKNREHLYPFGLGRRRCPGDSLAKSYIFIAFVTLIQNFKIVCSNGVIPKGETISGLITAPGAFTAEFITRE